MPSEYQALHEWLKARLPPDRPEPIGYALAIRPAIAEPLHVFPNPSRRTLRSDGAMRKSDHFRFMPFEGPMVPIAGIYVVVLRGAGGGVIETPIAMQGGVVIADPSPHVRMKDGWVSP